MKGIALLSEYALYNIRSDQELLGVSQKLD